VRLQSVRLHSVRLHIVSSQAAGAKYEVFSCLYGNAVFLFVFDYGIRKVTKHFSRIMQHSC